MVRRFWVAQCKEDKEDTTNNDWYGHTNDGNNRNMRQTMCYGLKGTKLSYADDVLVICNPYRAFHTDLFQDHVLRTTTSSHNLHLYFLFETNKSLKNE